jgi:hypothetical protein
MTANPLPDKQGLRMMAEGFDSTSEVQRVEPQRGVSLAQRAAFGPAHLGGAPDKRLTRSFPKEPTHDPQVRRSLDLS